MSWYYIVLIILAVPNLALLGFALMLERARRKNGWRDE